ncbi:MAG: hypothetical protein HY784_07430 [Chloroflexi bacterium]|nr:hypothetical protein [Chloroflexota bacterium]
MALVVQTSTLPFPRSHPHPGPPPPAKNTGRGGNKARRGKGRGWGSVFVLALAYAGYTCFALAFNVPDQDFSAFLIPMHLIAAVLMGVGLQAILNAPFALLNSKSLFHLTFCLLPSAFCLLPLRSLWLTLPRVDKSRDWGQYRLGAYLLNQPLAQGAALLADSQKIAPLYYLQVAEGVRPDLDIMVLPDEESYRVVLDERLAAGQAVYLGRYLPGLGSRYSLRSVGPLAEASSKPFTTSVEIAHPLATRLASKIRLLGYDIDKANLSAPGSLGLTLFWRTDTPVVENYLVSLRLVDASEQIVWQNSCSVPVSSLYPTNAWRPGEVISDFYSALIKAALAPGAYRLEAGLFPPFQVSTDAGWAEIAPITILPTAEPPSPLHLLRAQIGSQWLMGYQSPESVAPGSRLTVTLYWLHSRESETVTAFGETRSLAAWPLEQIVPQEYKLTTPTTGRRFDLVVDNGTSARCGWLAPITTSCLLAPVQIAGEAIAGDAINFHNQILLTHSSLDTPIVAPGGQAEVTLHWQGLQTIAEDYTVFVHLLGPDGLVHGQVDAWPVSGTQATSQWKPGEKIEDHYRIQVPADAPPGEYTVEVGLYLLATLERLPVLNAEGAPVDDKVLITGLTVGS